MDKNLTNSLVIDGISVHDRVNINRLFAKLLCINETYIENIETSDVYTDQNGSLITAGKLQDTVDEIIKNSSTIFVLKAIDKLTETSTTNGLYLCTYSFTKDTTVKSPMTYKQYVYNDTKIDDDVDNGDEITGNVNYTYKVNHLYLIEDNTTTEILLPTENLEIISIFLKLESNNSLFLYEYNNDVNWMSIGVKQILQSNNSVVLTPSKKDINISSNNAVICNDTIKGSSVGDYSLVSGHENECTGNSSFVSGSNNSNSSNNSLVSGVGLKNNNENGTVIGKYNDTTTNNLLFCVGCGTNDNDRKNALVVDNDGLVNVNSISSSSIVVDSNDSMITIDKGVINVGNNLTIDGVNDTINVGEIEANKITANEFNLKDFSLTNINSENITNKNLVKTSQLQITNSDQIENPIIERIIDTHDEYENLTDKSNVLMNCNCIDEVKPGLIKYNNDNGTGEIFNSYNLEGGNKASGNYSHAEGYNTSASGDYSHASGIGTVANQNSQTVVGKYNNTNDTNANNSLFVVGNGTEETRNNAFIIDKDGNATVQNKLTAASITNKTNINSNGINTKSLTTTDASITTQLIISTDSTQTTINSTGINTNKITTNNAIINDTLTTNNAIICTDTNIDSTGINTNSLNASESLIVSNNDTQTTINNTGINTNKITTNNAIINNSLTTTNASITTQLIISTDSTQTTINNNGIIIGDETTKTTITNNNLNTNSITLNNNNITATTANDTTGIGSNEVITTKEYVDNIKTNIDTNINNINNEINNIKTNIATEIITKSLKIPNSEASTTIINNSGIQSNQLTIGSDNNTSIKETGIITNNITATSITLDSNEFTDVINDQNTMNTSTNLEKSLITANYVNVNKPGLITSANHSEIFNCYKDGVAGLKGNVASGNYSHAEGSGTKAEGNNSHAEGSSTTASGSSSHAEGSGTTASGECSHAEGSATSALGHYSHAGGCCTTAYQKYQTVIGAYNIVGTSEIDTPGNLFIVGNGTAPDNHSNAFVVDKDGNATVQNKLTSNSATIGSNINIGNTSITIGNEPTNTTITNDKLTVSSITLNNKNIINTTASSTEVNDTIIATQKYVDDTKTTIENNINTEITTKLLNIINDENTTTTKINSDGIDTNKITTDNATINDTLTASKSLIVSNNDTQTTINNTGINTKSLTTTDASITNQLIVSNNDTQTTINSNGINTNKITTSESLIVSNNDTQTTINNTGINTNKITTNNAIINNSLTTTDASITNQLIVSNDSTQTTINSDGIVIGNETTKTTITNNNLNTNSITLNGQNITKIELSNTITDDNKILPTKAYVDQITTEIGKDITTNNLTINGNTITINKDKTTITKNNDITDTTTTVITNNNISTDSLTLNSYDYEITNVINDQNTINTSTNLENSLITAKYINDNKPGLITTSNLKYGEIFNCYKDAGIIKRNVASGNYSHAEGGNTQASGNYSHAGGYYTTAYQKYQTVIGAYNIVGTTEADVPGNLFIIGNGIDINNRSNAFVVDKDGNATVQNNITSNSATIGTNTSININGITTNNIILNNGFNFSNDASTVVKKITTVSDTTTDENNSILTTKAYVDNEINKLKEIITPSNSIKLTNGSYTVNITLNNNGTLSINGKNNNNNTPYSLNVDVTGEVNVMPV